MSIPTVHSSPDSFLQLASIPIIDIRFLSQSELNSLALCSNDSFDLRRCDDVVVPKIDRSIFNESAGSRKQTYCRLRLARGPTDAAARPHRLPPSAPHHYQSLNPSDDAERIENQQIILFLRKLFLGENSKTASAELPNRKRRPAHSEENGADSAFVSHGVALVNQNGAAIEAAALAEKDDIFGPEVRRRTAGLKTQAELLGYLEGLEGQWGSRRKRRKIVDAANFGDELPRGWKILLGLKRKEGHIWLACRKYISPKGQAFESCKEVSSYLLSLMGTQNVSWSISGVIDESTNRTCKLATRSAAGHAHKDDIINAESVCYSAVPISSISTDYEKKIPSFKVQNTGRSHLQNLLECRKCRLTFGDKDAYVQHLLSFHRRKAKRWGLVKSISDGVIIKDGKYECQFCHKTFDERHRYRGHVGIHAKYYVKGMEASPGEVIAQKKAVGTPFISSEMDVSVDIDDDRDSVPEISLTKSCHELNSGSSHHETSTKDTKIDDSTEGDAREITHEIESVDNEEKFNGMTDNKSQVLMETNNSGDVKLDAHTDSPSSLPTNKYKVIVRPSQDKDPSPDAMLDENDKPCIEQEKDLKNPSVYHDDNVGNCGIEATEIDILTSREMESAHVEMEKSGNESESVCEGFAVSLPARGQMCDNETYATNIFTASAKEYVSDETEKSREESSSGFQRSHPGLYKDTVMEIFGSMDEDVLQNAVSDVSVSLQPSACFPSVDTSISLQPSACFPSVDTSISLQPSACFPSVDTSISLQPSVCFPTVDTSISLQPSARFPSIDIIADKREDGFSNVSEKIQKMSSFEELGFDDIDPSKYGLVTDQDSSSYPVAPIDLGYCAEMEEGLNNSVGFEWDTALPKTVNGHQLTTVCVWCGMEFDHEGTDDEPQSDSVGYMCPTCKSRISRHISIFGNGL